MSAEKGRPTTLQLPEVERQPRNIFYVESRRRLRSIFPRERLFQDLDGLGLRLSQAARQSGVDKAVLHRWKRGESVPYPKTLLRLLDSLGIDRTPFEPFLTAQGRVLAECRYCGKVRPYERGQLKGAAADAKGRQEFRRLPNGNIDLPCYDCSQHRKGTALKRRNEQRLRARLGPMLEYLVDDAKAGKPEARKEIRQLRRQWCMAETPENRERRLARVAAARRRPRTEAYRRACAVGNVVARAVNVEAKVRLKRPFCLCPLCGLVAHSHRPGRDQAWHQACWHTWRIYYQREARRNVKRGICPQPLREHGPKPETHLARNYRWLIAFRGQSVVSRELGRFCREMLASARKEGSRATVTEGMKAFIRLLPGSWDLVFSDAPHVRRTNTARQELVPLPLEIHQLVGVGGRDRLIQRLLGYGMRQEDVARLTWGLEMGLPRVRGIAAGMQSGGAASA